VAPFNLSNQITISAWVNIRSIPQEWMAIITKGDAAWRISTEHFDNQIHFGVGYHDYLKSKGRLSFNQWHHLLCVNEGQKISIYIDGKLDESKSRHGAMGTNKFPVYIGENAERPNRFFDGLIDDVRVYNYALSENEFAALAAGK